MRNYSTEAYIGDCFIRNGIGLAGTQVLTVQCNARLGEPHKITCSLVVWDSLVNREHHLWVTFSTSELITVAGLITETNIKEFLDVKIKESAMECKNLIEARRQELMVQNPPRINSRTRPASENEGAQRQAVTQHTTESSDYDMGVDSWENHRVSVLTHCIECRTEFKDGAWASVVEWEMNLLGETNRPKYVICLPCFKKSVRARRAGR